MDTRLPSLSRNHTGLSENMFASNSKRLLGSFPVQIAIWIHLGGIPIFRQSLKLGSMRMVANYTSHHIPLYIYIYYNHTKYVWRFPQMGIPPKSSIYRWIFHEINHPMIEVHPFMETPMEPSVSRSCRPFFPWKSAISHLATGQNSGTLGSLK